MLLTALALLVIAAGFLLQHKIAVSRNLLVVLGSGGHTGEMLTMLESLDLDPEQVTFAYGSGDALSVKRSRNCGFTASEFCALPRARRVGQSLLTSVFTSLQSFFASIALCWHVKPRLVLCNGPSTCVIILVACRLLCLRTKCIYVESMARVTSLSLSGTLVYHLRLADEFVVQWPELASQFPGTHYGGILV